MFKRNKKEKKITREGACRQDISAKGKSNAGDGEELVWGQGVWGRFGEDALSKAGKACSVLPKPLLRNPSISLLATA